MKVFACFLLCGSVGAMRYCAPVSVETAAGLDNAVSGYFSARIVNGLAKYAFSVDLSKVTNCDFTAFPQVLYHIHTNSVYDATKTPTMSCTNAGFHYDPDLACSPDSAASSTYCPALNRTLAQGYTYNCSAAAEVPFYDTPTGRCEVGDLSGNLGLVPVSATMNVRPTVPLFDAQPPYVYNFNRSTADISAGWRSIVFHCGDATHTRIACGDFQMNSSCVMPVEA